MDDNRDDYIIVSVNMRNLRQHMFFPNLETTANTKRSANVALMLGRSLLHLRHWANGSSFLRFWIKYVKLQPFSSDSNLPNHVTTLGQRRSPTLTRGLAITASGSLTVWSNWRRPDSRLTMVLEMAVVSCHKDHSIHVWTTVYDVGPTSTQHWFNVCCLLGWRHRVHSCSASVKYNPQSPPIMIYGVHEHDEGVPCRFLFSGSAPCEFT